MKRKLSYLIVAMILGILITYYFLSLNFGFFGLLIFILLFFTGLFIRKPTRLMVYIIMFLLGALLVILNKSPKPINKFIGEKIKLEGIIISKKIKEDSSIYRIKGSIIIHGKNTYKTSDIIRLNFRENNEIEEGDRVKIECSPGEIMGNRNPKLYNFKRYLESNKLSTSFNIGDEDILSVDKEANKIFSLRAKFRNRVEEVFSSEGKEENYSLIKSIILGDIGYLDDIALEKYRDLGLAHLLAVSGLHIGIISSFFIGIFSRLGFERKYNYSLVIVLIWIYSFLISFPVSTIRASIIITISLIAQMLAEPYDDINSLCISAFILLIINPFYIFNIGFILSYLASLGLLIIKPRLVEVFYPYDFYFKEDLLAILAVQLTILPVQAYYFNQIPIINILANLLIVPLVSLALKISFLMVLLPSILVGVNKVLWMVVDIILTGESSLKILLMKFPYGKIEIASPKLWEIFIYYLIIFLILGLIDISRLNKRFKKLIIVWTCLFVLAINLPDNNLYIEFIDVGQGDAALIRKSGRNYLIDTGGEVFGSYSVGENITLPFLKKHGYFNLDGLFISHFHEDHSKAAGILLDELKVYNTFISYKDRTSDIYKDILSKSKPVVLNSGDTINLDRRLSFKILNPGKDVDYLSDNNKSMVILIKYLDYNILFTGDMEKEVERELMVNKEIKNIDIIKVPHHGSKTSSSKEFVEFTRPKYGVISLGLNNSFNHPNEEVLLNYNRVGSKVYRTDRDGFIRFKIGKNRIKAYKFLENNSKENMLTLSVYFLSFINAYTIICIWEKDKERENWIIKD